MKNSFNAGWLYLDLCLYKNFKTHSLIAYKLVHNFTVMLSTMTFRWLSNKLPSTIDFFWEQFGLRMILNSVLCRMFLVVYSGRGLVYEGKPNLKLLTLSTGFFWSPSVLGSASQLLSHFPVFTT